MPMTFERPHVQVKGYYDSFNTLERGKGAQVTRKEKVAEIVDKFYSLVRGGAHKGPGRQRAHFLLLLPAGHVQT